MRCRIHVGPVILDRPILPAILSRYIEIDALEKIMWRRHWGGPEGRGERMFEKGEFKYLILDLLQQQPAHGYELIRRLEERSGGHYAPSPGLVYPTLQMLEDMGCVAVTQESGRKVY